MCRTVLGLLTAGAALLIQSASPAAVAYSQSQGATPKTTIFTFVGCVKNVLPEGKPWAYTGYLQDSETGATYALTGVDVNKYVGKKVQIQFRLVPSPNVAGQAGDLDPSRAIVAAGGPAIPPAVDPLPTAQVNQLRTIGVCEEPAWPR
jgi:hypothetical protein